MIINNKEKILLIILLAVCLRWAAVSCMEQEKGKKRSFTEEQKVTSKKAKRKTRKKAYLLESIPVTATKADRALFKSIVADDVKGVQRALKDGASINVRDDFARTPLHWAATDGNLQIIHILIGAGAPLDARDRDYATPLFYAIDAENPDIVVALLDQPEPYVNVRDISRRTPLHDAAHQDNLNIVQELILHGADVNAADEYGATPLHDAAEAGRLAMVEELLKASARVNALDGHGRSPLVLSAQNGQIEIVRALLKEGADANLPDERNSYPLLAAAFYPKRDVALAMVKLLLESNAIIPNDFFMNDQLVAIPEITDLILTWAREHGRTIIEPRWLIEWRERVAFFDLLRWLREP